MRINPKNNKSSFHRKKTTEYVKGKIPKTVESTAKEQNLVNLK